MPSIEHYEDVHLHQHRRLGGKLHGGRRAFRRPVGNPALAACPAALRPAKHGSCRASSMQRRRRRRSLHDALVHVAPKCARFRQRALHEINAKALACIRFAPVPSVAMLWARGFGAVARSNAAPRIASRCHLPPLSPRTARQAASFRAAHGPDLFAALFVPLGVHLPYFPLWLEANGFDAEQIAIILAAPMFLRVVTTPFLTALADEAKDRANVLMSPDRRVAGAFARLFPRRRHIWWCWPSHWRSRSPGRLIRRLPIRWRCRASGASARTMPACASGVRSPSCAPIWRGGVILVLDGRRRRSGDHLHRRLL